MSFSPDDLPGLAFAFMLLACRVGSACMLLPGIGEIELPMPVRAGFAMAFVLLLMPVLGGLMPAPPDGVWPMFALLGAEIATGLMFGWLTRIVLLALPVAGQFIAGVSGLANVIQPDAETGPQTAAISHALTLAAPVAIFATGLHAAPLAALANSYAVIGPGVLLPVGDSVSHALGAAADAFAVALQLASPFVLAATLWQFALGIVSRLVPQMQVYFAAMPGQIGGGLLLFALLSTGLFAMWQAYVSESFATLPGH